MLSRENGELFFGNIGKTFRLVARSPRKFSRHSPFAKFKQWHEGKRSHTESTVRNRIRLLNCHLPVPIATTRVLGQPGLIGESRTWPQVRRLGCDFSVLLSMPLVRYVDAATELYTDIILPLPQYTWCITRQVMRFCFSI